MLSLGLDLQPLDGYHPDASRSELDTLLWDRYWEYGMNLEAFPAVLVAIAVLGFKDRVAFLVKVFVRILLEFQVAWVQSLERTSHSGYMDVRVDHTLWL